MKCYSITLLTITIAFNLVLISNLNMLKQTQGNLTPLVQEFQMTLHCADNKTVLSLFPDHALKIRATVMAQQIYVTKLMYQ